MVHFVGGAIGQFAERTRLKTDQKMSQCWRESGLEFYCGRVDSDPGRRFAAVGGWGGLLALG